MKISLICNNLSRQPFGRAALLAEVLSAEYAVEIVGVSPNNELWQPWSGINVPIRAVVPSDSEKCLPRYLGVMKRVCEEIRGDVVYAVKTRLGSLGPALMKKYVSRIPMVLDIDDWESSLYWKGKFKDQSKKELLRDPESLLYTVMMEKMAGRADDVTVVSESLRKKYGSGKILIHGRNTEIMNPERFDKDKERSSLGWTNHKVGLFLGTATLRSFDPEIVISALGRIKDDRFRLAIVGTPEKSKVCRRLLEEAGDKVMVYPEVPFEQVPRFLIAADFVLLPSADVRAMEANVPAKLFDAMAMACPIVATSVSGVSPIIDGCAWLVRPGDSVGLASSISNILANEMEAAKLGRLARKRCVEKYSYSSMLKVLMSIFEPYKSKRKDPN